MLKICLVIWKFEHQYAYKRYAYKKTTYISEAEAIKRLFLKLKL